MKTKILAVIISLAVAAPAYALDLHSARASGAVVEQSNGYIKVGKSSPEVEALVAEVNAKRRAEYERIAKEKGSSVDAVAAVAAQEIAKKR